MARQEIAAGCRKFIVNQLRNLSLLRNGASPHADMDAAFNQNHEVKMSQQTEDQELHAVFDKLEGYAKQLKEETHFLKDAVPLMIECLGRIAANQCKKPQKDAMDTLRGINMLRK